MLDLLVIGAGLGGLCAALTAAEAGQSVRVVAKGMGALHWHAGSIDALGYMPGSGEEVRAPMERIDDLPEGHPYRLLGREKVAEALAWLEGVTAAEGLPYWGAPRAGENWRLVSSIGAARPCYLAPNPRRAGIWGATRWCWWWGSTGCAIFIPCWSPRI